jgi:hypothetical protein
MNDITFFEAARSLAERMIREGGATPDERAALGFRLATARQPRPDELDVLVSQYRTHRAQYEKDRAAAEKLLTVGESKRDVSMDSAELAAWAMVASILLNLDETITRP